ncbi:MAG: AAA family ATPase [Geminicoccaceae bacterium]
MSWLFGRKRREREQRLEKYLKPKWSQWALSKDASGSSADMILDFHDLAKHGFLTPSTLNSDVARNYSVIKRRLFQRLSYFGQDAPSAGSAAGDIIGKASRPVLLVTSGSPAEGKTFSTVNLALSLALEERIRVLLIDADLAKPSIPEIFGYSEDRPGLFEYLTTPECSIDDFILKTSPLPISILPAGQATASPAQLLAGDVMTDMIDLVTADRKPYDIVLLDGPPILATTEAVALAPIADEIILVVGAGDATCEDLGTCLDFLGGIDRISMIINRLYFPEKSPSAYPYGNAA